MKRYRLLCLIVVLSMVASMLSWALVAAAPSESTVGTTTSVYGLANPNQHRTFYAVGRHWVFWDDGANMVFDTSVDGLVWTGAPTTIGALRAGEAEFFDMVIDGAGNLHYALCKPDTFLYYRMGAPQADGSITWAQAEQTVLAASTRYPSIGVNTAGNAYIGYQLAGDTKAYVGLNANVDGTWANAAGFPYKLSDAVNAGALSCMPVGANMLVTYGGTAASALKAQLHTPGVGWGAEETVTTSTTAFWSSTTMDNDVYVAFRTGGAGTDTRYVVRESTTGTWSAENIISTTLRTVVVSADETSDVVFFFYRSADTGAGDITYKKLIGGVLDTNPTVWVAQGAVPNVYSISVYPWVMSDTISFAWQEDAAPDTINYSWLTRPTATLQAETGISMTAAGVTSGTWNYTPTSIGNAATVDTWIKYGLITQAVEPYSYTSTTAVNQRVNTNATTRTMPNNLTPGGIYYNRASIDGWGWSAEDTTAFTMPIPLTWGTSDVSSVTGSTKAKLYGRIASMGVASSTYYYWTWGYAPGSLTNTTTQRTATATGIYSEVITGFTAGTTVYYRFIVQNGATTSMGVVDSFAPEAGTDLMGTALSVVIALAICVSGMVVLFRGSPLAGLVLIVVGIIAFYVVQVMFG